LSDLFCPPTILESAPYAFAPGAPEFLMAIGREGRRTFIGIPIPPTPEVVRQRMVRSRETLTTAGEAIKDLPGVPEIAQKIPDGVLATIERAGAGHTADSHPQRWRVTFVSASPRDMEKRKRSVA
jgi:hypothetical protein